MHHQTKFPSTTDIDRPVLGCHRYTQHQVTTRRALLHLKGTARLSLAKDLPPRTDVAHTVTDQLEGRRGGPPSKSRLGPSTDDEEDNLHP
jgi:hypothetical protein